MNTERDVGCAAGLRCAELCLAEPEPPHTAETKKPGGQRALCGASRQSFSSGQRRASPPSLLVPQGREAVAAFIHIVGCAVRKFGVARPWLRGVTSRSRSGHARNTTQGGEQIQICGTPRNNPYFITTVTGKPIFPWLGV